MDQERHIVEPNQVLHPGKARIGRYNDANGAVCETTHLDAHGNALTVNHQLGPKSATPTPESAHHAPPQEWQARRRPLTT